VSFINLFLFMWAKHFFRIIIVFFIDHVRLLIMNFIFHLMVSALNKKKKIIKKIRAHMENHH